MQTAGQEYTQHRNLTTSRPRVDPFKYEDRPSLGCETPSSRRTLLHWYHESLFTDRSVSWVRIAWYQQIRHKNVRRNTHSERSTVHQHRETCGKSQAKSKTCCEFVSQFNSYQWKKMDRHWRHNHSITVVLKCQNSWPEHCDMNPPSSRRSGAVRFDDLIQKLKENVSTFKWTVKTWVNSLAQGGGKKKRFQYCLNPSSSNKFMYFRAIQGHSGENFVDPLLQDDMLLPADFAEYIYHIGNSYEMHSMIQSGLIPGGKSNRRDRQSVFFTAVNPMYANQDLEEVRYDMDKPRIAVYKHTWRVYHNTVVGAI